LSASAKGDEVWLMMRAGERAGVTEEGVERRTGVVVGEYEGDRVWRVADCECEGASERQCFISVCEGQGHEQQ
jgi:hypothetical protein